MGNVVICIFMYTPPVRVYVYEQKRRWVGLWLVPGMFHDALEVSEGPL